MNGVLIPSRLIPSSALTKMDAPTHGVCETDDGRFKAAITHRRQVIQLGKFETKDEAHAALTGAASAIREINFYINRQEQEEND